ncbi:MAG: DUF3624 family protein [Bacteroidetes bacterium]|nr:DUF3624 family protein [Bacteroidota bacterium]
MLSSILEIAGFSLWASALFQKRNTKIICITSLFICKVSSELLKSHLLGQVF